MSLKTRPNCDIHTGKQISEIRNRVICESRTYTCIVYSVGIAITVVYASARLYIGSESDSQPTYCLICTGRLNLSAYFDI